MFAEERYRLDPPFEPPDDLFWQHEMNDEIEIEPEENEEDQNNICDGGEVE